MELKVFSFGDFVFFGVTSVFDGLVRGVYWLTG